MTVVTAGLRAAADSLAIDMANWRPYPGNRSREHKVPP
jgi:hypothetical protein